MGIAAPKPKYALPVVQLREGDGEVEMGYVDEDEEEDEEDMFEEGEEEEDEGMEQEEREWALVEQHPEQQQRRQQYHDTTTATYHSNEANYRDESTYRPNETTAAYDHHTNKTIYRPETATAATFANAGPPGVCFYPTPSLSAYQYPYPSRHQYSSSRRW